MSYPLVSPEDFTQEQKEYIQSVQDSISLVFCQPGIIVGAKDIHSRHIVATDYFAELVGLSGAKEVAGRLDRDFPCKRAEFAALFVEEDNALLHHENRHAKKSMLHIFEYATGVASLLVDKHLLKHEPSQSTLGIIYTAHKMNLPYFFNFLQDYFLEFGVGSSIEKVGEKIKIGGAQLTEFEHEICFLMAMNWSFKHIVAFVHKYRPSFSKKAMGAIYRCRDDICQKLGCEPSQFRDKLIDMGLHRKMPSSFFNNLVGHRHLS